MTIQDYKTDHIPHLSPKTPQSTKRPQKKGSPNKQPKSPKTSHPRYTAPKSPPKGTTTASTPTAHGQPGARDPAPWVASEPPGLLTRRAAPVRVRARVPGHAENRASEPSTFGASSMRLKRWQKPGKYVAKSEVDALYKTNR